MPIARELRHLYRGPEYRAQRARIVQRERNECKWCGKPNGAAIQTKTGNGRMFWRLPPLGPWLNEDGWPMIPEDVDAAMQLGKPRTIRVVLTMAHLNHDPRDRRDQNVALLCQWHHLMHDRGQHKETRKLHKDMARPLLREAQSA